MPISQSQASPHQPGITADEPPAAPPVRRSRPPNLLVDFYHSLWDYDYWIYSAWMDVLLKYRTTFLGPVWIVAGMALFIVVLGALYQRVLVATHPTYLAHLTIGMILWSMISQFLVSCCRVYKTHNFLILNGKVRYPDYVLKLFLTSVIILLHNMVVLVGVFLFTKVTPSPTVWVLLITIPLAVLFLLGAGFLLSVVGARFLDLSELLQSVFRIAFFITPIVWTPTLHGFGLFLYLNPFYYLLEIIRAPIIEDRLPWLEIASVAAAIPVVWLLAMHVYTRGKNYIPVWI
jgi:ABC-type polysaccharide/polyol phosphate export permease